MAMAQYSAKLAFGVEIELLLKPKEGFLSQLDQVYKSPGLADIAPGSKNWATGFKVVQKAELDSENPDLGKTELEKRSAKANAHKFRSAFRDLCAKTLTAVGIPAALKSSDFTEWSVVDEVTLDEISGFCRVEFVSRTIASDDDWQSEFDQLYTVLDLNCEIALTTGCSTHVHVSPSAKPRGKEDRWSHLDLRSIMKAISYYDQPITKVMPAERKANPYARSNMELGKPSGFYPAVAKNSWKPLFDYYDAQLPKSLFTSRAHDMMGGNRLASWNFEHITDQCGTIEFRRCPGCKDADKAKHWVNFTLGFVYQAAKGDVDWSAHQDEKKHPSVAELSDFVGRGVQLLEPTCSALRPIAEDTSKPMVFSARETGKKMDQLMHQASQYAESVRRTPPGTPVARSPANSPANSRPVTPSNRTGASSSRPGTPNSRAPAPNTGNTPKSSRAATPTGRAPASGTGGTPTRNRPATPTGRAPVPSTGNTPTRSSPATSRPRQTQA